MASISSSWYMKVKTRKDKDEEKKSQGTVEIGDGMSKRAGHGKMERSKGLHYCSKCEAMRRR